tara:strand:+ start:223 stop:924 length:702 start_codon:yes stop_codon:yes gene_type:complete
MDGNPIDNNENLIDMDSIGLDDLDDLDSTLSDRTSLHDQNILYDLMENKDDMIENLKETNLGLLRLLTKSCIKIGDTNDTLNDILSKFSTTQDIEYVMSTQKNLINKVDLLTEYNKTLKNNLNSLRNKNEAFKYLYLEINNLYISKFHTNYIQNLDKEKIKLLEEKLEEVEKVFKCQICFTNHINVIILPCRHIHICKTCIEQIIENTPNNTDVNCPVCNAKIVEYKNVYLPL